MSAPAPLTVKAPADSVTLPVAPTVPMSWLVHREVWLVPQTLGVTPPPQVSGEVQVPQEATVR